MRPSVKTTAILIDGSNLHATLEALGLPGVDFKKVREYFDNVLHSVYFSALPPKDQQSTLRPMIDFMEYNGWRVYQKETREFIDATGARKIKGNMDIEIAVIAGEIARDVTDIVLFTGDGDFRFLVDTLQRQHRVCVTVVSSIITRPALCADILRRQADKFIDVADLYQHINRSQPETRSRFMRRA